MNTGEKGFGILATGRAMWPCLTCGAAVRDPELHQEWHDALDAALGGHK